MWPFWSLFLPLQNDDDDDTCHASLLWEIHKLSQMMYRRWLAQLWTQEPGSASHDYNPAVNFRGSSELYILAHSLHQALGPVPMPQLTISLTSSLAAVHEVYVQLFYSKLPLSPSPRFWVSKSEDKNWRKLSLPFYHGNQLFLEKPYSLSWYQEKIGSLQPFPSCCPQPHSPSWVSFSIWQNLLYFYKE